MKLLKENRGEKIKGRTCELRRKQWVKFKKKEASSLMGELDLVILTCTIDAHVTGASVNSPRQMNSKYIKTIRRSIYKTRRPEHPHSPIRRYKQHPQVPASRPHYIKFFPQFGSMSTYISTSTALHNATIAANTPLLCQNPAHFQVRYPMQVLSVALAILRWLSVLTQFDSPFLT